MDEINTWKSINHAWCCDEGKCNCDNIDDDSSDLGNRIIQEMWDKEKRFINSKNKTKWMYTICIVSNLLKAVF